MDIKITPRSDQLDQMAILRDIDVQKIKNVVLRLSSSNFYMMKPEELQDLLLEIFEGNKMQAISVSRLLISLYMLCSQRNLTADDLLQGLLLGIQSSESKWTDDELAKWENMQPVIKNLLSLEKIKTLVKALDLSYDYANLFQNAKILTDIRPVFSDDASDIYGATISFTLRLYYDSLDGSKNISIALDAKDVNNLKDTCLRAIRKAERAKRFMVDSDIQNTFICGENNDI